MVGLVGVDVDVSVLVDVVGSLLDACVLADVVVVEEPVCVTVQSPRRGFPALCFLVYLGALGLQGTLLTRPMLF